MDDLISKKEVECMIHDYFKDLIEKHITKMDIVDCNADLQKRLDNIPTAYNPDKVVEKINDKIQNLDNKSKICMDIGDFCTSDRLSDHMCAYIDCREIVKRGGVE